MQDYLCILMMAGSVFPKIIGRNPDPRRYEGTIIVRKWILEELIPALHEHPFTGTRYATYGTSNVVVSTYHGYDYVRKPGDLEQIAFGVFYVNVDGNKYHVLF